MKAQLAIQKEWAPTGDSRMIVAVEKILDRAEEIYDAISRRAFELFEERGREEGNDRGDWLRAEFQVLKPLPIELIENADSFTLRAQLPGYKAEEVKISAEPLRIIINAKSERSEDAENDEPVFGDEGSTKFSDR